MNQSKINYYQFLISGIFILTIFLAWIFDIHEFHLWSQVRDFYEIGETYNSWSTSPHAVVEKTFHLPRALLAYPVVFLHQTFGFRIDSLFSIQVTLMMLLTSIFFYKLLKNIFNNHQRNLSLYLLSHLLFLVISFTMNGRLAFSFLGFTLLFSNIYSKEHHIRSCITLLFATWLTSVSSGTFSLNFIFLVILLAFSIFKRLPKKPSLYALPIFLSSYQVYLGLIKNLHEYDNSLIKLMNHGWGSLIQNIHFNNQLLAIIAFLALIAFIFLIKKGLIFLLKSYPLNLSLVLIFTFVAITFSILGKSIFWGSLPLHIISTLIILGIINARTGYFPKLPSIQEI